MATGKLPPSSSESPRGASDRREARGKTSRRRLPWAVLGLGVALVLLGVATRWWLNRAPASPVSPEFAPANSRFVMGALEARGVLERSLRLAPDGDRIAYNKPGSPDIWISDFSGLNARKIQPGRGAHLWPAWSPDGAQLVYASFRGGDRTGLWVTSLEDGAEYQLTRGQAEAPAWSPDGKSIAFVGPDLRLVPSTGGTPRSLTEAWGRYSLHWSADSKKIAYWWGTGANFDAYYYDVERGTKVRITTNGAFDFPAGWSSDGRHSYFISNRGGSFQLWKVVISESTGRPVGDPVQVTHFQQFEVAQAVQPPDCRTIALQLRRDSFRVALMDVENGRTKKVLVKGSQPQWLDGQRLLYLTEGSARGSQDTPTIIRGSRDLAARNIATGQGKKLTERGDVVLFRVSPDRTSVAFLTVDTSQLQQSDRQRPSGTMSVGKPAVPDARKTLYVIPAAGGPESKLLEIEAGGVFAWSPDSTRLAAFRGDELLLVPVRGDPPQVLISKQKFDTDLVCSPDGNSIFYTAYDPGPQADIYRIPSAGGEPKNVTRDSKLYHCAMACSPDGKKLVYTKLDSASGEQLWSLDLETGRAQPLETPGWNPVWSPDGSRLAFWSWRRGPVDIFTIDAHTGAFDRLTEDEEVESELEWSPDGKSLAFTLKREERQLWLLDNP